MLSHRAHALFLTLALLPGCGSDPDHSSTPASATSVKDEALVGKTADEVKAMLGEPLRRRRWKNTAPPPNADAAAMAEFRSTSKDEIWIYRDRRVHFNLDNRVLKVDEPKAHDLEPE